MILSLSNGYHHKNRHPFLFLSYLIRWNKMEYTDILFSLFPAFQRTMALFLWVYFYVRIVQIILVRRYHHDELYSFFL